MPWPVRRTLGWCHRGEHWGYFASLDERSRTAGVHRVVPITSPQGRFSIPFFYQPKVDAVVEPWLAAEEIPHYRAFSWQEYIRGRVTDNYSDLGEEDIQIDRYKVA